jgi:O-antigen/teichoic acid export membrane protein
MVAAGSFAWAIRKYKIKIHVIGITEIFRVLWREKTIFFSGVVINLYTATNIIILGLVQTTRDVAFFSAASKMIIISQTLISTPLSLSLFPFIGESFGQGRIHGIDRVKRIAPFITVFTFVAGILLWIAAPLIIRIFFGAAFYEASTVLRILCFIPLIVAISDLLGIQTMINLNMDRAFFNITLIGAIFGLGLNFFLSTRYGAEGTAWAWVLSELVITSCMWMFLLSNKIQLFDSTYFRYTHFAGLARPFLYFIRNKIYRSQQNDSNTNYIN